MSKIRVALAVSLILVASTAGFVRAEAPAKGKSDEATLDVLLSAIRANRKALVAANLNLTDDEAAKFWPIYDRYQKEIITVSDRGLAVIKDYMDNYANLPDDKAKKLVEDYLTAEADRVQVRRTFIPEFAAVLTGRKLARLYQIENKMDAVIRYDLASTIPVIDQEAPK